MANSSERADKTSGRRGLRSEMKAVVEKERFRPRRSNTNALSKKQQKPGTSKKAKTSTASRDLKTSNVSKESKSVVSKKRKAVAKRSRTSVAFEKPKNGAVTKKRKVTTAKKIASTRKPRTGVVLRKSKTVATKAKKVTKRKLQKLELPEELEVNDRLRTPTEIAVREMSFNGNRTASEMEEASSENSFAAARKSAEAIGTPICLLPQYKRCWAPKKSNPPHTEVTFCNSLDLSDFEKISAQYSIIPSGLLDELSKT